MSAFKLLTTAAIALTLLPAAVQAAGPSIAPSDAARSLSLSHAVRANAKSDKGSHILGLGVLATVLIAAGVVAATVIIADSSNNHNSSSS